MIRSRFVIPLLCIIALSNASFAQNKRVYIIAPQPYTWVRNLVISLTRFPVVEDTTLPADYGDVKAVFVLDPSPASQSEVIAHPKLAQFDSLMSFLISGGDIFILGEPYSDSFRKIIDSIGLVRTTNTHAIYLSRIDGNDAECTAGLHYSQRIDSSNNVGSVQIDGAIVPIMFSDAGPYAWRTDKPSRRAVWERPRIAIGPSDSALIARVICGYFNLCSASVEAPNILSSARIYQDLNSTVTVQFNLASSSDVSIELFDVLGNKLRTVLDRREDAGDHQLEFDLRRPTNLASGTYYCRLKTASGVKTAAVQME